MKPLRKLDPIDRMVFEDQRALAIKRVNMQKAGVELVEPTVYLQDLFNEYKTQ
ncbi:MAG: hypothetical protein QXD55_00565 [Candidatus Aenigmatarchaeota archaeon]